MGNPFIPFPRCENIIIVGDAAAEYLGALRIYGRGLIGGDVPSMELLHPMEKHLECVSCFLNDPTQVLLPAVRRMKANFVVLEENGSADFNPAAGREVLEKEGISVKILDVRGSTESVLRRAGKLFGEENKPNALFVNERSDWQRSTMCANPFVRDKRPQFFWRSAVPFAMKAMSSGSLSAVHSLNCSQTLLQ